MSFKLHKIKLLITSLAFCLSISGVHAKALSLDEKLRSLESETEGRLGVFAINTENDHRIGYRADEIFPTGCTSKVIGVAAVLKKSEEDPALLSKKVQYLEKDLVNWNPITEKHVADGMTVQELCSASISFSDNTAMNLLLRDIGGIEGMNSFARSIEDRSFRQDNDWPAEAYSGGVNNVKDSSTPKSMVESLKKLTVGDALSRPQRDLLITWLINTKTGSARIRSGVPKGWIVGNKTGTGGSYGSTNDLAIVWPLKGKPILLGIYYTSDNEKAVNREDVISKTTKILIEEFKNKDTERCI